VGNDEANNRGVLLHYTGGSWSSVSPPSVSANWELFSVHFTSVNEGWAVGLDESNMMGVLLHYISGNWQNVSPPAISGDPDWDLHSVHFTSSGEGWAVGIIGEGDSGLSLHYTGDMTSVPTMTEWGMIIFIFLAGLGAVYYLRRQKTAKSL
jgi:hypothetical protein